VDGASVDAKNGDHPALLTGPACPVVVLRQSCGVSSLTVTGISASGADGGCATSAAYCDVTGHLPVSDRGSDRASDLRSAPPHCQHAALSLGRREAPLPRAVPQAASRPGSCPVSSSTRQDRYQPQVPQGRRGQQSGIEVLGAKPFSCVSRGRRLKGR
jgi:hypothetical protein